ncbi:hypothetical protein F7725_001640 [Dissostichus mawsoni]|uniref:DUF4371 domain-containing protein n=1 Tax=Dissostichus mawsoni TaxID=36200 RepID=A0A7J5Y141_DISMA|nr:hypothetical protein F7725_001640 [Dissostichus mawsoni]
MDLARTISTKKHNQKSTIKKVKKNRDILMKLIVAALYLARQEQAFRGHNEAALTGAILWSWYMHLQNLTLLNYIIENIARVIQDETDKEIQFSPFIALQVDDQSDISNKCQLTVIIRYVNEKGTVCEHFLSFFVVSSDRDAKAVTSVVMRAIGTKDKETIAQSAAFKQKLEDFDLTFLLGVYQSIFSLAEPLFQVLQSNTVDIKKCHDRIMSTLNALKATRTDETFSGIYDEIVQAVGEPVPQRKCRRRGWDDLEQGVNQHQEGDEETVVSFRRQNIN